MFFTAKTHKQGCPFRVIVTEKGSWQANMSRFLQRHLSNLQLNDPFLVSNSEELVQYLQQNNTTVQYGFSLDVEDLFYSIPHIKLFTAVKESIEDNGTIPFQNECGIQVDSFLELLKFYLSATVVTFNDTSYIQKKGICIGSCVAPVLCDIFLAKCDRAIANTISSTHVSHIFRYVDDYLVLLKERPVDNEKLLLNNIRSCFLEQAEGLKFTDESPENSTLQFLDLRLSFLDDHTC
ncbi:MAG: reverse transcriptase domain-containing protein, partial [Anaplasma sp.]|nr:reverse transcriptase domain-containing protein [Anaplasma sp.]